MMKGTRWFCGSNANWVAGYVRTKCPKRALPREECTDFALALIWRCKMVRDSMVGVPMSGVIVGWGNPAMMLATDDVGEVMIGLCDV